MNQVVVPWITPKIFSDLAHPEARISEFFEHYAEWFETADEVVVVFATGNGDHILNYQGRQAWDMPFDWARYNSYAGPARGAHPHNSEWLRRVREGGERSSNPYQSGPTFVVSEQVMNYDILARIYESLRREGRSRRLDVRILEYLEPGPEFCESIWKTQRHAEVSNGTVDAGGAVLPGLIDVIAPMAADVRRYAGYPGGVPEGTAAGEFVARQCGAFVRDMELDGVFLGNQFGLIAPWFPEKAVEPTDERRAGITAFFRALRRELGDQMVYWMDSYWPPSVEESAWCMNPENYSLMDAVMCCTFAVLVERTQIIPNISERLELARRAGGPRTIYSLDFFDPWYMYRTYLDDIRTYDYQRDVYRRFGGQLGGVSFFANDTFGFFVPREPLDSTVATVREVWGRALP